MIKLSNQPKPLSPLDEVTAQIEAQQQAITEAQQKRQEAELQLNQQHLTITTLAGDITQAEAQLQILRKQQKDLEAEQSLATELKELRVIAEKINQNSSESASLLDQFQETQRRIESLRNKGKIQATIVECEYSPTNLPMVLHRVGGSTFVVTDRKASTRLGGQYAQSFDLKTLKNPN